MATLMHRCAPVIAQAGGKDFWMANSQYATPKQNAAAIM
jgi:hypothetical protein